MLANIVEHETLTMQFRVQFLDGSARVVRELYADARNATRAIKLVRDIDWPPRAATIARARRRRAGGSFQGQG